MALKDSFPSIWHGGFAPFPYIRFPEQIFPSRPTWILETISPGWGIAIAHSPGRRIMELEIKGVGATIMDHGHLWRGARSGRIRAQRFHWNGKGWKPGHSHSLASWGSHGGSLVLSFDCLLSLHFLSLLPHWPASVPIN